MRNMLKWAMISLALILCVARPTASYADWHGRDHGHGHSYFGVNLSLWPDRYYDERIYFVEPDYTVVAPVSYQPVMINGVTYYVNNGTYYLYTAYGYQVVAPPVVASSVATPPVVVSQSALASVPVTATAADDSFTINIPNDKGGYTAVVLKRSGKGFTGPQGEFYDEFPKVAQLKAMYGK